MLQYILLPYLFMSGMLVPDALEQVSVCYVLLQNSRAGSCMLCIAGIGEALGYLRAGSGILCITNGRAVP